MSINTNSRIAKKLIDTNNNKLLHELFEDQVDRMPNHISLSFDGKTVTYKELNSKANSVAHYLRGNGVVTGSIVAIMVQRSFEMIIGILSVLKAGGIYLPIDPEYPQERINFILEDSNASLVLSDGQFEESLILKQKMINISDYIYNGESPNIDLIMNSNELAYIIYTSGSTGKPKGVMIEHKSIVNTIRWRKDFYNFDETDAILQLPSISFDSSVEDIFTALSSGARLVLIKQVSKLNTKYLEKITRDNNVTHFLTVPSFYKVLLQDSYESLQSIKSIAIAGENFTSQLVQEHLNKLPNVRLVNEYGPTENSVCSTVYEFSREKNRVLIGKPINNVTCYVIDQNKNIVPIGEEGELCVSGIGLARGYLNRVELTAEKFIQNPFVPGDTIYKTGDVVKLLPDGNIEFIGRIDHQIKIRGFRVELGEIECLLQGHTEIDDAIVIARDDKFGYKYLCAYYISDNEFLSHDIIQFLSASLPDYMIPKYYLRIDRIPLTPNGKTDRNALLAPKFVDDDYIREHDFMIENSDGNSIESRLIKLLSDNVSLNAPIESIKLEEKIETIGVDSIGFIKLMVQIETEFEFEFDYDDLDNLINPTIHDLIIYINNKVC